ncbi:AAA family ATPase [Chromobacterium violaceum]|uniref:AAA family ATPase n=1 Tax=Chromobacterium violaceum TaxID=536 RepID=UPI0015FBFDED|nr:AAA family ATPase [Chromobacterium violaceum]MBA8733831.1 AAA family ATPase [Chromobacterium violaceum]
MGSILENLGPRICILGPSNSGKSTLAEAIARKRDLSVIHLDQLFHQPNTNWMPRTKIEFIHLHDQAIEMPRWVMDGNYTWHISQRLERATGFILLDISAGISLFRYVRRALFEHDRPGALEGGRDSLKWEMIYHIAVTTRKNRVRYAQMFEHISLTKLKLTSQHELNRFYQAEGLSINRNLGKM